MSAWNWHNRLLRAVPRGVHTKIVPQPLQGLATVKHHTLCFIIRMLINGPADTRRKAIKYGWRVARVGCQHTCGAIGILDRTHFKTGLAKHARLLVCHDGSDGD